MGVYTYRWMNLFFNLDISVRFLILDFSNGQEVEQKIKIEANVVFQLLTFTSKKILSSDLYIII